VNRNAFDLDARVVHRRRQPGLRGGLPRLTLLATDDLAVPASAARATRLQLSSAHGALVRRLGRIRVVVTIFVSEPEGERRSLKALYYLLPPR
jgi:hypothetical protein